jgi:hypothetical protein
MTRQEIADFDQEWELDQNEKRFAPDWQSIDLAPKDKPVLVYGLWAGEINGPDTEPGVYIAKFSGRSDYEGFWWTCNATDAYAAWVKPTHWMPLPQPPIIR